MEFFQFFLHKVTETQSLNNELNYFFRENLVLSFSDQKGPKWTQKEIFQILRKINAWIHLIFFIED